MSPPLSVDHSTCQVLDGIDALLVCACVCSACNNYPDPADNALTWAAIRQASRSFLSLPGPVGFITAIDLGIGGAVHSPVKQPDGRRLALQLLRKVYGRHDVVADGPTLDTPGPTVGSGSVTLPFRDAVSLHAAAVSKVRRVPQLVAVCGTHTEPGETVSAGGGRLQGKPVRAGLGGWQLDSRCLHSEGDGGRADPRPYVGWRCERAFGADGGSLRLGGLPAVRAVCVATRFCRPELCAELS